MKYKLNFLLALIFTGWQAWAQQDTVLSSDSVEDLYDSYIETAADKYTDTSTYGYFSDKTELADSISPRTVPDSLVKELQADDAFWYANAEIRKRQEEKEKGKLPLSRQAWFQTLLWVIIIAGFAGFVTWYLAGNNIALFRKKKKMVDDEAGEEELGTEDLFAINYQREIDKASRQGNYRLATRLLFLRLLKNLSERNIIEYKQGKTNFDYLLQLQPTGYYPDFFRITRNYEYSWYGQFEVSEEKFQIIKKDFDQFENKLR